MPDRKIKNIARAEKEYLLDAYQGRKIIIGRYILQITSGWVFVRYSRYLFLKIRAWPLL